MRTRTANAAATCVLLAAFAPLSYAGSAFLFDVSTGEHISTLQPDNPADSITFGATVASSESRAVVRTLDQPEVPNPGNAFLFDLVNDTQIAALRPPTLPRASTFPADISFGNGSVSASAIGLQQQNSRGAVLVFDLGTGTHTRTIHPDRPIKGTSFGVSNAWSQSTLFVGTLKYAPLDPEPTSVSAFDANSGEEIDPFGLESFVPDTHSSFGIPVAVSSGHLVVGVASDKNDRGARTGSICVYDLETDDSPQKVIPYGASSGDRFGVSLS